MTKGRGEHESQSRFDRLEARLAELERAPAYLDRLTAVEREAKDLRANLDDVRTRLAEAISAVDTLRSTIVQRPRTLTAEETQAAIDGGVSQFVVVRAWSDLGLKPGDRVDVRQRFPSLRDVALHVGQGTLEISMIPNG